MPCFHLHLGFGVLRHGLGIPQYSLERDEDLVAGCTPVAPIDALVGRPGEYDRALVM
jgi:hypothetical protein